MFILQQSTPIIKHRAFSKLHFCVRSSCKLLMRATRIGIPWMLVMYVAILSRINITFTSASFRPGHYLIDNVSTINITFTSESFMPGHCLIDKVSDTIYCYKLYSWSTINHFQLSSQPKMITSAYSLKQLHAVISPQ